MKDDAERLADLETTVAFQDRLLSELNEALVEQQDQIERLETRLRELAEERAPLVRDTADEEPPPHY